MAAPISPLPTPPTPADTPTDFNTKAFALLGSLPTFVTEANAQAAGVDAAAAAAGAQATTATTKAGEALASANAAALSKTDADAARDAAALSAASALDSKNAAQTARAGAEAAAAAAHGGIKAYATKAEAAIASTLLPDGADVEVSQDESLSGARTRYKVQGGALVFVVNLDQMRIDLANNSDPLKGATLVSGVARVVPSIAELRALPKTGTKNAFVAGYYAAGDGGGGAYYYDGADTTAADNGGSVIVAADGGRWKLSQQGYVSVRQFGAKGDGVTDDTAAIAAAIAYISAAAPWPTSTSRATNRPALYFPAGVYPVSATLAVLFSGLSIQGEGPKNTVIAWASATDAPVFDIGTFSATPADIFSGPSDTTFTGIRIQHSSPGASGSRKAQGIRISGGGGLRLRDVAVLGFKYGVNSPYGGDFNSCNRVLIEYCDVGYYQGPGGQQFYSAELDIFSCREGFVIDRPGQMHHDMLNLANCENACVVFEVVTDTSTRQLTSFSTNGTSFQQQIIFNSPWMEGNAGAMGDAYTPTHFFECRNNGSDAIRDITINNPKIVAGQSAGKTTTSYFANTGAVPARRVRHNNIVFAGVMTKFLSSPGGDVIDGYRVENGYTSPAFSDNSNYQVFERDVRSWTMRSSIMGHTTDFLNADGTSGTRVKYDDSGVTSWAFRNAGSWVTRFGIDIQNRRLYLGDPAASAFSVSYSTTQPAAGTYEQGSFVYNKTPTIGAGKTLLGWHRLTTGSSHVAGTDWTPCYATTE